jgi:hypothetical protein
VLLVVSISVDACVFPRECFGLWCAVCLAVDGCAVVAVSTFEQRTLRRHNNTHCTYGVNLQHEGSISEFRHCAKSFFLARADTTIFFANNNMLEIHSDKRPEAVDEKT